MLRCVLKWKLGAEVFLTSIKSKMKYRILILTVVGLYGVIQLYDHVSFQRCDRHDVKSEHGCKPIPAVKEKY